MRVGVRVSHKDSEFILDVNPTVTTRDYLRSLWSCSLTLSAVHSSSQVQELEQNMHCSIGWTAPGAGSLLP